ncbi:MAG: hypothetical protein FJX72_08230 [Armatimonadetes bacterium]|nr:hypothetical protein [Armatimonadota bacterium]
MWRPQLEVKWLPSYCPDLNDIERTLRRLKASRTSSFLYNSLDALVDNVRKGIAQMDTRCAPMTSRDSCCLLRDEL